MAEGTSDSSEMDMKKNKGATANKDLEVNDMCLDPDNIMRVIYPILMCQTKSGQTRDNKKIAALCKDLNYKFSCLTKDFDREIKNHEDKVNFIFKVIENIKQEFQRKNIREAVALNRKLRSMERVWASRKLPLDKGSLQSVERKDAFDMTPLSESLPLAAGDDSMQKAKKVAKEFLAYMNQKHKEAESEKAKISASTHELNNNNAPSSSSKLSQPLSLGELVKRVCSNMKNLRTSLSNCKIDSKTSSPELQNSPNSHTKERKNLDEQGTVRYYPLLTTEIPYRFGEKSVLTNVLIPPEYSGTKNIRYENQREDPEKKEKNMKRLQRKARIHKKRLLMAQHHLHESILLGRELSRLTITNSRREDISENTDEFEVNISSVENKDQQTNLMIEDRKNAVKQKLA